MALEIKQTSVFEFVATVGERRYTFSISAADEQEAKETLKRELQQVQEQI